jgi:hypothetical protein
MVNLRWFKDKLPLRTFFTELTHTKYQPGLKEGATMKVPTPLREPEMTRPIVVRYGIGSGAFRPVVYAPNHHNEVDAVKARVVAPTPKICEATVDAVIANLKRGIYNFFPRVKKVNEDPWPTYIENSNASPSQKAALQREKEILDEMGITCHSQLGKDVLYEFSRRLGFVKVEGNCYRSEEGRKMKAARMIQTLRRLAMVVLTGPWVAALQRHVKSMWRPPFPLVFTSGLSTKTCAQYLMKFAGLTLEDDVGKWDASVHRKWLEFKVWLYKLFGAPTAVAQLFEADIFTHGVTFGGIRYKVDGTVHSGNPDTSLFNSILNALLHVMVISLARGTCISHYGEAPLHAAALGYRPSQVPKSWSWAVPLGDGTLVLPLAISASMKLINMLVQGDDNAAKHRGERIDFQKYMSWFGFESEAIYRDDPTKLQFCSNRLVPVADGWAFVPKRGRVMAKLGYIIDPPRCATRAAVVRGTALGLLAACSPDKMLTAYLQRMLELAGPGDAYFTKQGDWQMKHTPSVPTSETDAALADIYEDDGASTKSYLAALRKVHLGEDLVNPHCTRWMNIDTGGPVSQAA